MNHACRECHSAKVKCDKTFPCSRCQRLKRTCVPHESKQGQKRKRLAKDGLKETEDAHVSAEVLSLRSDHHGLQYLVRSWVSLALRRRSFSLLSRAASVAVHSGISMDQVLCETEKQRGMDFLYPILLTPREEQNVLGTTLRLEEVPAALRSAIACSTAGSVQNRWLWIREITKGMSRYYCSPAFQNDLASMESVVKTYGQNKKSVAELFLANSSKHVRVFAHQITLHTTAECIPQPSRVASIQLQKRNGEAIVVDQVACLNIVNLDQSYYSLEYIVKDPIASNAPESTTASDPLPAQMECLAFDNMLDLDELVNDTELEFMFDLLGQP